MTGLIDLGIKFIFCVLFIVGAWLYIKRFFLGYVKRNIRYDRPKDNKDVKDNKLIAHLKLMLFISFGHDKPNGLFVFMFISIMLFFVSLSIFLILFGRSTFFMLISLFISAIPYIFLKIRVTSIQRQGSYEAETLVSELINQYKINNLNMIAAIDNTIFIIKDCPHSKKALFNLSLVIKDYGNDEKLNNAIDNFVASTNTEWAKLLGMNILESISNGTDISVSLDSILSELKEIKSIIEKDRRSNNEAFNMVKFIIPGVYILSPIVANRIFGFTYRKFFDYQFGSELGIRIFIIFIIFTAISSVIMFILSKPKFDY